MKALILTCSTGQGHNSVAAAVQAALTRRGCESEVCDYLSFQSNLINRVVCGVHNFCAVYLPKLFGLGSRFSEESSRMPFGTPFYRANAPYAYKLYAYIREHGFDTIVMPHAFPAECLTAIRRIFPDSRLRTVFIATDYACVPFLCETDVDLYCIPLPELTETFVRSGVPKERIVPLGIPVRERFLRRAPREAARSSLSIPADVRTVLIMTGSMGSGNAGALLAALRCEPAAKDALCIVMGGNNEQLKDELRQTYAGDPLVRVLDYCDAVETYFAACDVLLTKPGGLSATEAMVYGVPLVLNAPLPGWEAENVAFFTAHGLARTGGSPAALAKAAADLLDHPALARGMVAQQRACARPDAADALAELLLRPAAPPYGSAEPPVAGASSENTRS